MNKYIIVNVPYGKKIAYTLFVNGSPVEVPHVEKDGEYVSFKFKKKDVFVLFYTFADFRRAYIVTGYKKKLQTNITLPGISEKLSLLYVAKGKKIDHLKRSIFLLTQKDKYKIYYFPAIFWFKLAALIQFNSAKKSDVMYLYEQFKSLKKR